MSDINRQNLEHKKMKDRLIELGEIVEDQNGDLHWKSNGRRLDVDTKEDKLERYQKKGIWG